MVKQKRASMKTAEGQRRAAEQGSREPAAAVAEAEAAEKAAADGNEAAEQEVAEKAAEEKTAAEEKPAAEKAAQEEAEKAAADEEFDRQTRRLAAVVPLRSARHALVGTLVAALIAAIGAIVAALVKGEPATPPAVADSPAATVTSSASAGTRPSPRPGASGGAARPIVPGVLPDQGGEAPQVENQGKGPTKGPGGDSGGNPVTVTTTPTSPRITTAAPLPVGRVHDGPHRGTIGWGDSPFTVDVENAGFRGPGDARQGEISAAADGIRSAAGVRIARFRSSAVSFGRCAELDYAAMGTFIAAGSLARGDWICADDGVRYIGTYDVEIVPGGANSYYQLLATAWFRQ